MKFKKFKHKIIHLKNACQLIRLSNLKKKKLFQGLAMGNAITDPINMLDYSDFAYQLGLVDDEGKREMKIFEILARQHIYKSGTSKNVMIISIFILFQGLMCIFYFNSIGT